MVNGDIVEITGKHNTAKVFTTNFDDTTASQIVELLNQEFVKNTKIRIMPDCHAGSGCVIGTTMEVKDKVVPNLVGVDIGCGMYAAKLKEKEINFKKLDSVIREHIPSGFSIHEQAIASSNVEKIKAPINVDKALKSLGTLGSGNHFIEVSKDESNNLWLVIHTGSRHLGIEVCNYYQDLAYKALNNNSQETKIREIVKRLKEGGREQEIEKAVKALKAQKTSIPKNLSYIEGENFNNYINDMRYAQEHAAINRQTIASQIVKYMDLHIENHIDTIHNYIDIEHMILRKGAVSAQKDEILIIPMNMRDGSLLCVGKGNPDWNYSAPHGAGRILSRTQAKQEISMDDYKKSMKDIYTTSVNNSTLDEAPFAYKPMQEIINNIGSTVSIISCIKPVYNFKASELAKESLKETDHQEEELELD